MTRMRRPSVVALFWVACLALAPALARLPPAAERAIDAVSASALRAHVAVLASDEMQGRGIGQAGNQRAETYAAQMLEASGVAPGVNGSFLQRVDLYQPALSDDGLLRVRDSSGQVLLDLRVGRRFQPLPQSAGTDVEARLVFAGHGISAPTLRHDDYARIDPRGAIVVALEEAPASLTRRLKSQDAISTLTSIERKIADATARGARGLLVIRSFLPYPDAVFPEPSSGPFASYRLYAEFRAAPLAAAAVSAEAVAPIRDALSRGAVLTATLRPGLVAEPIPTHNVIGFVEGRDPGNSEMVVVGAHLDHEGITEDGRVFNGADDNASGTAAVLEMAAAFARAARDGHRPARAVVFALWNAEERGSLGAEAYVADPHPRRRIVANINLDMVGRGEVVPDPNDPRFRGFPRRTADQSRNMLHLLGYSYAPELARAVAAANEAIGLELRQEYDREAQNLLQRSDNWAFLRRGIPAVFLTTGLHPDYHTPDDDTERIDFAKLERITKLAGRTAWLVADR